MTTVKKPTVREAVLKLLRDLDIRTVFGNPGSTELPMFRAFPDDFRYVLGLQESVVVGMADGYAQARHNAAIVNLHSAVGVGHAMGNIFTAFKNQTPLIVTAGQQSRSILPFDPFLSATQSTELPRPYVKWSCEPARAQDVPLALARAYHIAMQPPRGPVFVSIPADDWEQPTEWVATRQVSRRLAGDPEHLARFAAQLNAAHRPAIVVGPGVDRDQAVDMLVTLAEKHEASVYVAPMSARCSFPERHALFKGFLPAMRERIVEKLRGHDLVLVLGAPAFSYHIEGAGPHVPEGCQLLQIVDDPNQAAWTPVGDSLVSSLDTAVQTLLTAAAPCAERESQASTTPRVLPSVPVEQPMSVPLVLQALGTLLGPDDVVYEEAPGSRSEIQAHLPMRGAESFYTMASGGLGHGMPAAVGMALARREMKKPGRVIALIGDGSSMYSIQALYSAMLEKLPMTFLILNNGKYRALQDFAGVFGYAPGEIPAGTDLPQLDFVRLAEGQGMKGDRVFDPARLQSSLKTALSSDGPCLLELVVA